MDSKKCTACLEDKSVDLFYNDKREPDGKFKKCKICVGTKNPTIKTPLVVDGKKNCSRCKTIKEVTKFYPSKKEPCGYRSECIECKLREAKLKENKSEYRKKYRETNKKKQNLYNKLYYRENKQELLEKNRVYHSKNRHVRQNRDRERSKSDAVYKLSRNVSGLAKRVMKRQTQDERIVDVLGMSAKDFRAYVESQFLPWMNWDNNGKNVGEYNKTWQLDHVIPMCNAQTEEEVYLLNHWSNFQPLCAKKNNQKQCAVYPCSNLELKIMITSIKQIIKIE